MPKLKLLLKRPLLTLLLLFLLMEFLPVFGKNADESCLYESHDFRGEYTIYYILQPDGDLISWGKGPLDHDEENEHLNAYPYFLRKKIARGLTSFACTPNVILCVDRNHVLWGSGTDKELLHSKEGGRVRIMENITQVVANVYYTVALKTDRSVWGWPGRDMIRFHQDEGMSLADSNPVKIAENMQSVLNAGDFFYGLSKENALSYLDLLGGKLILLAKNVKDVSYLNTKGRTLMIYLTREGDVYTLDTFNREKIAGNVRSLFQNGLLKNDNSMWEWKGNYQEGKLVKIQNGVRTAYSDSFYIDTAERVHWVTSYFEFPVPSRSVRNLDPTVRTLFLLALIFCLLYDWRQKNTVRELSVIIDEIEI